MGHRGVTVKRRSKVLPMLLADPTYDWVPQHQLDPDMDATRWQGRRRTPPSRSWLPSAALPLVRSRDSWFGSEGPRKREAVVDQ